MKYLKTVDGLPGREHQISESRKPEEKSAMAANRHPAPRRQSLSSNLTRWVSGILLTVAAVVAGAAPAVAETLTILYDDTQRWPYHWTDDKGAVTGFEIDLGRALCAAMKADCQFVAHNWDTLFDVLQAKQGDIVMSGIAITPERQKRFNFSDKYVTSRSRFITRKGSGVTISAVGLKGRAIAPQRVNTLQHRYLTETYPNAIVKTWDAKEETFKALSGHVVDAVFGPIFMMWHFLRSPEGGCCEFVGQATLDDVVVGATFRKEDTALLQRFNSALARVLADGTYEAINARYVPFNLY